MLTQKLRSSLIVVVTLIASACGGTSTTPTPTAQFRIIPQPGTGKAVLNNGVWTNSTVSSVVNDGITDLTITQWGAIVYDASGNQLAAHVITPPSQEWTVVNRPVIARVGVAATNLTNSWSTTPAAKVVITVTAGGATVTAEITP
jgi:hypothetical protein